MRQPDGRGVADCVERAWMLFPRVVLHARTAPDEECCPATSVDAPRTRLRQTRNFDPLRPVSNGSSPSTFARSNLLESYSRDRLGGPKLHEERVGTTMPTTGAARERSPRRKVIDARDHPTTGLFVQEPDERLRVRGAPGRSGPNTCDLLMHRGVTQMWIRGVDGLATAQDPITHLFAHAERKTWDPTADDS